MDLDFAGAALCERGLKKQPDNSVVSTPKGEYKRQIEENLTLDSEGKPKKMLPFKSPSDCRRSLLLVDEMMEEREKTRTIKPIRHLPTSADQILHGPKLIDDYYLNLIDWGKENILAIALGRSLYLWKAETHEVQLLLMSENDNDYPTSVAWSGDGKTLAVGFATSQIELWDAMSLQLVRTIEGHSLRVGSLSWNHHILTSGSHDASIINHDVRSAGGSTSHLHAHSEEVCGLKWSGGGEKLASGGNDNLVHVWDSSTMRSSRYLHRFNDHSAAVRALAWCPFKSNTLASGGGTTDRCIKIWNVQNGKCTKSIDTGSQVCALEWNRYQKEILSAHGYNQNQLSLWSYPLMSKIGDLTGHTARVLHLCQSPDGSTVVSAAADEMICFWKAFEPPPSSSKMVDHDRDSIFSLKRMHIR
ncbi:cell division cycle 20.2, cofactor of APC complex-like [Typha latifolia]|uniref:cell division cycle 20.2, cofactor of APC complex-like n=1 Tax=Typha latifolia TaxID=4733 RepID=UPI003C2B5352